MFHERLSMLSEPVSAATSWHGDRTPKTAEETLRCKACGFALWVPVVSLRVSVLGLYDDRRFPGRCLLALSEHFDDLVDLPHELAQAYMADLRQARDAIVEVTGAKRVNYAVLGNAESHVHWHLIPRLPEVEPRPRRSPWQDPRPAEPLAAQQRVNLIDALRAAACSTGAGGTIPEMSRDPVTSASGPARSW